MENKNNCEIDFIDSFSLSSAFTQTFIKKDECILASFEGNFLKYSLTEKRIKSEKNILNFLPKDLKLSSIGNYKTNPPYLNHCIYNPSREEIYFCLLNGVFVNLKNNLKTNFVKLLHNTMIKDIKLYRIKEKNMILTLGKEKILKILDLDKEEIKLNIDLSTISGDDPSLIESTQMGTIVYCNSNSSNLNLIKINN